MIKVTSQLVKFINESRILSAHQEALQGREAMTIADTVAAKIATSATYGGAAGAILFGLSANEFAALGGLVIGMIGMAVNIWFKHQHLKLARARCEASQDEDR